MRVCGFLGFRVYSFRSKEREVDASCRYSELLSLCSVRFDFAEVE